MPYDASDPRSQLATAARTVAGAPRPASYRELHREQPDEIVEGGGRTWWTRSQAMVIAWTDAAGGDRLAVSGVGEHALLAFDGAVLEIDHASGSERVDQPSVVFVPGGDSSVAIESPGTVIRVFAASTAPQLAARCSNAADYLDDDPNVADFVTWPAPPAGERTRVYRLDEHPFVEGRLGAIFRCSTVMINVLPEDDRPRDPAKLSPHHHDDFEQVSLQVRGDFVHHMRVTWTPDSSTWRDDEHRHTVAPAVVVIPPPLIHTSQAVGSMRHWLVDVFAPPRLDFSQRPGWVLNEDDYPMP